MIRRRSIPRTAACLAVLAAIAGGAAPGESNPAGEQESADAAFRDRVLPILEKRCFACHSHGANMAKGGLVLDSRSGWATGGDSGPAIVPGRIDESLLIQAIRYADLQMPPDGRLPPEEVAVLERWVAAGAADPRVSAGASADPAADLEARSGHWAFQPLALTAVPATRDSNWPRTAVDGYLLAALEGRELSPASEAPRHLWLRRVTFDLTGLPPTEDELREYLADETPEAEARIVDRLLSAPAFGERWARHWLDLVGYADQIGTSNNVFAEHAWRYRDYVIRAFNRDLPFDRFVREQIAGDLLPHVSGEQRADQLIATGFLLLGDLSIVEADKAKLRVDTVDQQVDKIGRALLGMTVGCARCHDHKFDPISQRDYYALAGILNGAESIVRATWGIWSFPATVELPESVEDRTAREALAAEHQARLDSLKAERQQAADRRAEIDNQLKPESALPADDPARQSLEAERKALEGRLAGLAVRIAHAEFFLPKPPWAFAVRELPEPQDMRITIRGNPHALGEVVPRGFPQRIAPIRTDPLPAAASGRAELAEWLVSPDNPLTARVTVNRIWQKLFGEGLVRSVDYFGLRGETPSHPELLDHLAGRFLAGDWSQKALIRELVLTRAYRLSSLHDDAGQAADPANRWLSRMPRRRLDAEALRDGLLAATGRLLMSGGGPSLPLEYIENTGGLGKGDVNPPSFNLGRFRPDQEFLRTVYLPIIRSGPQAGPGEVRNVFDFTQPAELAGRRAATTVPTQSLFLMNSRLMKSRARELALLMTSRVPDDAERLSLLWRRTFCRSPEPSEQAESLAFLAAVRRELSRENPLAVSPEDLDVRAWSELCHAVLASNEFLVLQ